MTTIGLIIWRFQPIHLGHELLIHTSIKENVDTLVLVGSINKQDTLNPYSFNFRKEIIQEIFENKVSVWGLPDFPSDSEWKDMILSYIPDETTRVILYCWDVKQDSAVQALLSLEYTLPFTLTIQEIPRSTIPVSSTQVRNWITKKDTKNLQKYLSKKTLLYLGIKL